MARHNVHVLSLCEVFDIDDGRNLQQRVGEQLVNGLNQSMEWGGTWVYAACYHYITLWRTDLGFRCEEETGFHSRVPGRSWQHPDWPQPVHPVNPHSPSSRSRGTLTMEMRKTIAKTSWDIVCGCDVTAQPVAVFGGDFNCSSLHWDMVLRDMDNSTRASRRRVNICWSRDSRDPPPRRGDAALACNCLALQGSLREPPWQHWHGEGCHVGVTI